MKTFYYIAFRKPRGRSKMYVGDGVIDAKNKTEARQIIADSRGVPRNLVEVREQVAK